MLTQIMHSSAEAELNGLMSLSPNDSNLSKKQKVKSKFSSWFRPAAMMLIMVLGMFSPAVLSAQTPCTGNITDTADGTPFVNGFDYEFITNADGDITINVELLDAQVGLVAFAQTMNPNFAEMQMTSTGGQSFTITYLAANVTDPFNVAIKFAFAGGLSTSPVLNFAVNDCLEDTGGIVTCTGNITDTADGTPFVNGFDYEFITNADGDVTINVELLDPQVGLVAFAQTMNPNFAELQMASTGGQSFTITYLAANVTNPFNVAIKFAFAGGLSTSTVQTFIPGGACPGDPPATAPTDNAPEPTCAAADVVPVYGDFYPSPIATNYDPNWGQSGHLLVNPAYDPGTGNPVLAYPNFNYQGTELVTTDLSGMAFLNFDIWTAADPATSTIQVSPINMGTGVPEFLVDVPFTTGAWTTVSLPIADFVGMTWDAVFQMKFAANGPGSATPIDIYLDNIFFSTTTCAVVALTAPVDNAPEPTCAAADVVSVYGDFYPSPIATNYDPNWGQSGHLLVNPAYDPGTGNPVLAYPNFNYQGTELVTTDLSSMLFLNFDIWTAADPATTDIQVSPINMGTGAAEVLVSVPYASGVWTSVSLPISAFAGMTWDAVFQMKFAANGPGSIIPVDIYLDNIFFSTNDCSVLATAPTDNAPDPTCAAGDVVSVYGDFYAPSIATNYDPNWGQSGFGQVDAAYDPGTGNPVLAYPNFNYQGTELVTTDLSGMAFLNFDIWTAADPANTTIQVSPINMGTGVPEFLVDVPFTSGTWTTISLPIADFVGMTWDAVFQMKFAANGPGSTTPVDIYLDNIFFSTMSCAVADAVTIEISDPCNCDAQITVGAVTFAQETITITPGVAPYMVTAIAGLYDAAGVLYTPATATAAITGTTLIGYVPADNAATYSITISDANSSSDSLIGGPCPVCPPCPGDDIAPDLTCASSDELLMNGSFADIDAPSAFPAPADFADWDEFGDNFEDALPGNMTVKMFGSVTGVQQDIAVTAGEWLCMDAQAITLSGDDIVGTAIRGEVKVEFYDAAGGIINGPFGTVLGDFNQTVPAVADVWTNVGGCIEVPANAVTVRAVIIFLNFNGEAGAIIWDNASLRRINPMTFPATAGECDADVVIVNPVATDNCLLDTFTDDFNGTGDASGTYPVGQTIVTYTATDVNGNQSVCSILVEVEDNENPTITCPDDMTIDTDAGICAATFDYVIMSDDNCMVDGDPMQTAGLASGAMFPEGTTMNTFVVTDEAGNTAECSFTVTVEDSQGPTANCQDVTLSLDENGEATITGGTSTMVAGLELGATSQLASDIISPVCGPVATAATICDCPAGFVATGIEGLESTDFGGLVGEFNIICRQLLPTGTLGTTSMVSCSNGTANTVTALGPIATTGDDVLVAAQSRIGCAIDRITLFSAPMSQVIAGSNTPNTTVGFIVGSNGGTGGSVRPLRTAPNNNVIVGMETFDNQGNASYSAGIAWRFAPIEEVLVVSATEFLIDNGSSDNCDGTTEDITLTVSQADFTCDDLIDGQTSTNIVVTLIVTDAAGNMSMCDATVTLMDDEAPSLTCPGTTTVNLEAGDCEQNVHYEVIAGDNCSLVPDADGNIITQTAGLPSGSVFEPGTTTNTFQITDASGNVTMCSFDVVVVGFTPTSSDLACNGGLNISLDQNCEAFIGADQILEGGGYACYADYDVSISGVVGQTIVSPGTYSVTITDPISGNSCWSTVTVEDKLAPTLVCSDCPPGSLTMIDLPFTGTIDADSPTWTRPFGQPGACNPSAVGIGVSYSTHEFLVVTGADSDFEVVTFMGDSFMAIYENSFDPTMPCANMVINNDDGGTGVLSQFDVMLETGVQYVLVVTTFGPGDFGDYIVELDTDAQLVDAPIECLFKCFDEAAILSGDMPVPSAVAMDNCNGNLPTSITDVVTDGAICGSKVITRTFSIIGDGGQVLTSCVAEYQLFAAQFSDFVTPPVTVSLPCGTGTSPEEIEAFFDNKVDTDGDGFPDTDITPTNDIPLGPNCSLSVIENNEGTGFGYITYPSLGCDGNTHLQAVDNNMCGFFTTFSDQEIPACGAACGSNNVKVIRTWTILDWCNPETAPFTFVQVIKSVDDEAPTMELANDFGVSVNPWSCQGEFSLPAPTILHDVCSEVVTYTVSGPAGTTLLAPNTASNTTSNWMVFNAAKGLVVFTYTASDCCGNTTSVELTVNVFDTTPPVPVASEFIVLNLTTNGQLDENGNAQGFAKLYNTSVDDGSYDGCSDVKIEIRREENSVACDYTGNSTYATNSDFPDAGSSNPTRPDYDPDNGEYVKFCCADITDVDPVTGIEFGLVPVRMRVFDDGNMNGIFGDWVDTNGDGVQDAGEYDNFNETWVTVRVEGKAIASLVAPPDVTLACDMDYTDTNLIGNPVTLALCGSESVSVSFTPQLNACGIGFVIATYTVEGSSPAITRNQRIDIENPYPAFDPAGIRFPRNLPTSPTGQITCTDDITYDSPTWTAGACDFIGYTEEVDTFFFEVDQSTGAPSDACFKILRRFTVIDWCVYDETNGTDGLYFGSQTIKITDRDAPVIDNCAPLMFAVNDNNDANGNGDICERLSTVLTNSASDAGDCASDWLKWQVFVDTWGDGEVDYEYSSFLPTNDSNINNDTNGNGIPDRYLAPTMSGEDASVTVTEAIGSSMNNHIVTWKVTDGCGNVASCTTTFMVVDKKAPTPYCVSLSTALMEDSQPVELWAIDFDLGAFDNCTEQENLRFTFSSTAPEDDSSYDADLRSSAMSFGTAGVTPVNIYVWDEKGNVDFCTVTLSVIDNDDTGGAGSRIAGITATELGTGVELADVIVEAALPEYPRSQMTNTSGEFAFDSNPNGIDYEIAVSKNDNHTNGVSTLDLVLIQRHILAFAELDSPYKVIAADINGDSNVSSIDVVELRKLILGVQEEFTSNTSWRFIDAGQVFADITSPWPLDETRAISNLSTDNEDENFVAVKIGDVNATATLNVSGATTEVRSGATMLLEVSDRAVEAGEQVEIAVSSEDFKAVSGLQMTIEFNGLTFKDVQGKSIAVGASNVGVISDNVITMSWNSNTAVSTSDDLFLITATATRDGNISEMINVTDRVITPEVYVGSSLEILNVELGIRGGNGVVLANQLMQNEPNPFKQLTSITFNLAKAGKATLTVRDVAGKLIRTVNGEYEAGMNTISLAKSDLNIVGVLYYTLESGNFSETKKMIVLD